MKKSFIIFLAGLLCFGLMANFSASAVEVDLLSDEVISEDNYSTEETTSDLPFYYSSVDLGYTTSIKRQVGNICWGISANATLESFLLKNNLFTADLNFNHLDLWATPKSNGDGWQRDLLSAGYGYIPTGYFTSWQGPVDSQNNPLNIGVTAIRYYSKNENTAIKEAIMRNGAVVGDYNSEGTAYNKADTAFCLTDEISVVNGHSISVVGWDDNYSKDNFDGNYVPQNDGAWLCKNSWGEYNSHPLEPNNPPSGYFWISYEDYYLFNDDVFTESYSIESVHHIKENDSIYQNEEFGATYEFRYIIRDDMTYFNVFDFSEKGNVIDKIVFETNSLGADYNVYFVTTVDGVPVADRTKWHKLHSGTVDYSGYTCCDIEDKIVSQTKGAIAIEIDTTKLNEGLDKTDPNYKRNGIGVCEWLRQKNSQAMIFTQQSEPGESFVTFNNEIVDLYNFYNNTLSDPVGGTFVIKAITNNTVNTTIKGDVNFDQGLDINDATMIQRYLVSQITDLLEHQEINADFNNDGEVNINDVTLIQKKLVNLI